MRSRMRNIVIILIAIFILISATVAVYAYLSTTLSSAKNDFSAASDPNHSIEESTNSPLTEKKNVRINVGNPGYAVYVRVAIVVTWENGGVVNAQKPILGTDYSLSLKTGSDDKWFFNSNDGFYYYETSLFSGETDILIEECYQILAGPDGYSLHVEIISQTIQAVGTTDTGNKPAVTDAWKVEVDGNGDLIDPSTKNS